MAMQVLQTIVVGVAAAAMDKEVIEILLNLEITPPHQIRVGVRHIINSSSNNNRETKPLLKQQQMTKPQLLPYPR
jgi:hypothetical protein